jgi:lambda repressor-like predicted transcriptional regulator
LSNHTTGTSVVKYQVALLLAQRGLRTFSEIAIAAGCSRISLAHVLAGRRRTPRIQQAVADLAGLAPYEIFGGQTHPSLLSAKKERKHA